jgi:N utilization substance protein B
VLAELPTPPEQYASELASGVGAHEVEIDALVARHATGWSLDHLPAVDRQLLRLATYEIAYTELPVAVAIDEAVDLANAYSTGDSGRYVNGVLSAVAVDLGRLEPTGP